MVQARCVRGCTRTTEYLTMIGYSRCSTPMPSVSTFGLPHVCVWSKNESNCINCLLLLLVWKTHRISRFIGTKPVQCGHVSFVNPYSKKVIWYQWSFTSFKWQKSSVLAKNWIVMKSVARAVLLILWTILHTGEEHIRSKMNYQNIMEYCICLLRVIFFVNSAGSSCPCRNVDAPVCATDGTTQTTFPNSCTLFCVNQALQPLPGSPRKWTLVSHSACPQRGSSKPKTWIVIIWFASTVWKKKNNQGLIYTDV